MKSLQPKSVDSRRTGKRWLATACVLSLVAVVLVQGPASPFADTAKGRKVTRKRSAPSTTRVAHVSAPTATTATLPNGPVSAAPVKASCGVVKVMPLGDSLTAFAESYRGPLFRQLGAQGYKVDFVGSLQWAPVGGGDADSEGHGGFTIGPDDRLDSDGKPGNIAQNVDAWIQKSKPDLVLLTIGTNDISGGTAKAAQAPGKLKGLLEHLRTTYPATIFVVGDIPPNIYNVKAPTDTTAVNNVARDLGNASPTDNVYYANTYATLTGLGFDPTTGTSDGTHFTAAGGELFAKAWMPVLKAVLDARRC
jgi:lysophospholipase L1-like esterase